MDNNFAYPSKWNAFCEGQTNFSALLLSWNVTENFLVDFSHEITTAKIGASSVSHLETRVQKRDLEMAV
jgi:hypothetical protein